MMDNSIVAKRSGAAVNSPTTKKKPSPLTGKKGDDTRTRILMRAAELFAENGYDKVGLQEIADAAGLLKGSIFAHFRAKRDLYVESVTMTYDSVIGEYRPLDKKRRPEERLHHYLDWFVTALSTHRVLSRFTLRMILDRDIELAREVVNGAFGRSHVEFFKILQAIKPAKDKHALAFFVYAIFILNDEFADFVKLWSPEMETKAGGENSKAFIESLIKSW